MFRYLLEAYDNLGYMSVVDRWRAVLRVSYSPHQRQEFLDTLEGMNGTVSFRVLPSADMEGIMSSLHNASDETADTGQDSPD